tara:strand:+ start:777 stop:974 length:198 start_codon:yes stop_codon:yes gene_type:complete
MRVRLGSVEVTDEEREIIYRYQTGKKGLATRRDVRSVYIMGGEQLFQDMECDVADNTFGDGVDVR